MMRTKFLFLAVLCLFAFSCDEDDVIQIPEEEPIQLTIENNLYEGDLYRQFLRDSITSTIIDTTNVSNLLFLDPNNIELQNELFALKNILGELQGDAETQDGISAGFGVVPRMPIPRPNPPNPCTSGACIPNLVKHLTISQDIASVLVEFSDPETQEIIDSVEINEFTPLPEYNNLVSAMELNLSGYTGALQINVTRTNIDNETISFSLDNFNSF